MDTISIAISHIKNIETGFLELPLTKGTSVIVGGNGSGKSTILQSLSQAFMISSLRQLDEDDFGPESQVEISLAGDKRIWKPDPEKGWWANSGSRLRVNGMYEGSLFYGSRFHDSRLVDALLKSGKLNPYDIVDADDYVKDKLSYILHGVQGRYSGLKKLRNRDIAKKHGLKNTPYFNDVGGKLISQYRMSSGECLLITLLHFVYNAIVRRSLPKSQFILALIDEIEVALHPIAVFRFLATINDLVDQDENIMVILTSHSPEVIRRINPKNIYKIENNDGVVEVVNPAYPSYVIRDVYKHDGFDTLILVEDILAKILVQKQIEDAGLLESRLIHIVPVGGWENVLKLHRDLLSGNVLGLDRNILSVIDGDMKSKIPKKYAPFKKLFLPIDSIEKYLLEVCVKGREPAVKKLIGDKYFPITSVAEIAEEHCKQYPEGASSESKKFYARVLSDLMSRGVSEEVFVEKLAQDLPSVVDFTKFRENLKKAVT
ncbi:MAG: AAA family ATPase [Cohaesibacter sp.]|jgi:predicted ATPase|nr:AAA family ATPase [Cohaesibacter sp.]